MEPDRAIAAMLAEREKRAPGQPAPYQAGHKNWLEEGDAQVAQRLHRERGSRRREAVGSVVLVLGTVLALVLDVGYDPVGLAIAGGLGLLMLLPAFFSSRDPARPPGRFERRLAGCWRWLRRLVCCGAGLLLLGGVLARMPALPFWPSVAVVTLACYLLYVGWFGQGDDRLRFRDDIALHKRNKKRYGWWF